MKKPTKKEVAEFLWHSNAIERVYDDVSQEQALTAWKYLMTEKKMTPSVVLKTHKILMLHSKLYPNEKGYFRNVMVWIGGHPAVNAIRIPELIEKWCDEMNKKGGDEQSKQLHVEYEYIHPFVDGNGRTGRMFMNWWRIKNKMPLLTIHEGEEQMKYYQWFK